MSKLSEVFKINGKAIYEPSSFSVGMEDLELSAERTADGILHRERVRTGVRKVSIGYNTLTQEEISDLLPMLTPEFFSLTYPDPETGTATIECYCAKKDSELYSRIFYNGLWRNIKFNCIER